MELFRVEHNIHGLLLEVLILIMVSWQVISQPLMVFCIMEVMSKGQQPISLPLHLGPVPEINLQLRYF